MAFGIARNYRKITSLGGLFFILQLMGVLAFSADNFIIARILGVADVTVFSIPQRMFAVIATIVTMLDDASLAGLWLRPSLAEICVGFGTPSRALSWEYSRSPPSFPGLLLLFSNKLLLWWVGPAFILLSF